MKQKERDETEFASLGLAKDKLVADTLVAQERNSVVGKVLGIRAKLWLDVQSEKDKAIINFRIARKTVYTPQRYPYVVQEVKVEYLTRRGVPWPIR
jgi:hypothetical protein